MDKIELPESWTELPFADAAQRVRSTGLKIQTGEYKSVGRIPIVDQGQKLVVGFTDNEATKFQGPLPIIVFGDHTREVKFVDFDFAVGADGTVLLKPDARIEPRFFYCWLKSVTIHQLGYSRHAKLLAEQVVRFPVSLAEQRRIVTRVESLTSRSQKLRELNASLVEDMARLLRAEYKRITEDAPTKPFSDVAKLVRRWVKTKPDQNYPETGIRSFGKGTFHKPALTGEQLGTKRICRIKAGDLVFMNVFAWEGAIAVAQPEDDGRVASHRFMMHEVLPDQATAEFLCYYFLTERGLEQIRGASPGSAGRNRTLGITKLEKIPVPVPPIEDQRRFAKLRKLYFLLQRLHREAEMELASFTPALLAKAFRGEL